MPLSMSDLAAPAFDRGLESLAAILRKGQEFAAAKKIQDAALLQARLYPDMLPLAGQVQRASDSAKGAMARLSEGDNPSFPDTEASFDDLLERVAKTRTFIQSVPADKLDGSETRHVELKAGRTMVFEGKSYLLGFALPNFYFHVTTAYAILRHNGVEVGKLDYLGQVPVISVN